jgi:AcrR family transcriptional regulator
MAKPVNQAERAPRAGGRGPGRSRRSGDRRRAILGAALRLFRKRGFHGTSIDDIGASAGVTGPAVYRHFSGKGEVLAEAIREGSRHIAAATRESLGERELPPEEALERLVRSYVEVALDDADTFAAYVLEARHLADEFRHPLRRSELRYREEWRRMVLAVHPEMDPEQARALVTMAIFAVTSLCMEPCRLDRAAQVELATSRVMALLLAPAS